MSCQCNSNIYAGASYVSHLLNQMPKLEMPQCNCSNTNIFMGVVDYSGIPSGGCFGFGGSFSNCVNDTKEVSLWDSFMGGVKQQAFTNPWGTASNCVSAVQGVSGILGSVFDSVGSWFA